jgi:thiamine biosynthesis lipoprotein
MKKQHRLKAAVLLAAAGILLVGCDGKKEPVSRSAFLLNTFVTVTVYDPKDEAALEGALELCSDYEKKLSKTVEGSEIYEMNHREKGQRAIEVSEPVARVLEKGLFYSSLSEGAFDITVEPLSTLWNFTGENPKVPDAVLIEEAAGKVDYKNVSLEGNQVIFADDETTIDLGAIAKGFIADEMKAYMKSRGVESAIINLGGNVLCIGQQPKKKPFKIGIQKPYADRSETIAAVEIRDLSVVSSGVYERCFVENGVNYHHILNPSTGYPYENGLEQVTIISPYSVDGDGLSTTCFALGLEKGMELIETLEGIYGIFMTDDGGIYYTEGTEELLLK